MTTPSDSFEYDDNSVVARVSFDIPGQSLNDIGQLTTAMGAMRTQLEAVARAQGSWLDYLNEVPAITQQANAALREQITLLERMSYIQNEIGGGNLIGGGIGGGGYAGGGGAGTGAYSTSAPQGYVNPWQGVMSGMGMGGGNPGAAGEAASKIERIGAEDPRLEANMQSARGIAINPALIGALGGAVARKLGVGGDRKGAQTPQKGQEDRDSSAPPKDDGTPSTSNDPNTPADVHPDSPDEDKKETLVSQVLNEIRGGKGARAIATGVLKKLSQNAIFGGGIGGGAGGGAGAGGAAGGIMGIIKNIALSPAGKAAGIAGLGALAFNKAQDLGEKYTEFQQLGSVQGGDAMTGMKYEAQARIMALNPFITTQQARQAMQMALKEGFRGDNYDTVQDFMVSNFKDLGISMGQSMELMKAQAKGLSEGDSQEGKSKDLTQTLNTMKELSANGGLSFPERANQLEEMTKTLTSQGFSSESINRAAIGGQEGYGDKLALRDSIGGIIGQATGSDMLMTLAANKAGLNGHLPGALPAVLDRAGYDPDEILELAASEVAGYVSGFPDKIDRIAQFRELMAGYGVTLDFPEAEALYDKVTGEEKPTARANRTVSRQGNTESGGGSMNSRGQSPSVSSNPSDAAWNAEHQGYSASGNAAGVADSYAGAGRGASFSPSGQPAQSLPQTTSQMSYPTVNSQGTVTGNVTITVDQAGRVTAPPTIQLTGQQKSAFAGYSSSQLNNPPPGDPTYYPAFNAFPVPGGGG